MHTAPSSAPTSPETDYHVITDLTSSIDSLSLSSSNPASNPPTVTSSSADSSRRGSSSSSNTSDEYEVILPLGPDTTSSARRDSEASTDSGVSVHAPSSSSTDSWSDIEPRSDIEPPSDTEDRSCPTPHAQATLRPRPAPTRAPIPLLDSDTDSDSDSESSTGTERPSRTQSGRSAQPRYNDDDTHSISSVSEARESIDSFFNDPAYTSTASNKLRLWQSLCIEFGLVDLDDPLANLPSLSADLSGCIRSATPTHRVPLPTSLTKAQELLKTKAHVNIKMYRQARADPKRAHGGVGAYEDLLYPSASAMIRATIQNRQFVRLSDAKEEWLTPLLRDFSFGRRRRG